MFVKLNSIIFLLIILSSLRLSSQSWPILQSDDPQCFYIFACNLGEIHPTGTHHFHEGIDIDCSNLINGSGVNIRPIDDGRVYDQYGNDIEIGHNYNNEIPQQISIYREFSNINNNLVIGDIVSSGLTNLGNAGNHLHLEMRIREGNDFTIINPICNNTAWQLTLPTGHEDTYLPQINDILIEALNNQTNNIPSGFCTNPESINGAVPFHNQYLKAHMNDTEFSTLSTGTEYDYPNEKIIVWGNIGFTINARDKGVNTTPGSGTYSGEGLTVSTLSYSYVSTNGIENEKYTIDFSEFLDAETYQLDQLFRIPYFDPEQMPLHYRYGNHDFIELRSTDNIYLHVHQPINGIQSNGIWFTKAEENTPHVFNQTPTQIAPANEFALYSDGEQTLRFHAEDAADQQTNEDLHLIVDNFLPFIKEVKIYRNENSGAPDYVRAWTWQNGTYEFDNDPAPVILTSDMLFVYITTSEPMLNVKLDMNSFSVDKTEANNPGHTEWLFTISSQHINEGLNQLEISGQDYAGNNVSENPGILAVHQQNGQWNPWVARGRDNYHSFNAEEPEGIPEINFGADIRCPDVGEWVHFTSYPEELPGFNYYWNFANSVIAYYVDGTSANSQNPVVYFSGGTGSVDVSLTVTKNDLTATKIKEGYIQVIYANENPAIPEFTTLTGLTNVSAGTSINFIDQSENSPISWYWTFEGASPQSSSAQNPTNICYATPGFYDVSLQVYNGSGNAIALTKEDYIAVCEVLPVLNMDCWTNKNILFINESVSLSAAVLNGTPPYVYTFNFNNEYVEEISSGFQTEQASYTFTTPGNKILTVEITDASNPLRFSSCNHSVSVDQIGPMHTVDFTWEPLNPILEQEITFTNLTTAPPGVVLNYSHWLWGVDVVGGVSPEVPAGDPQTIPYSEMYSFPYALETPSTTIFNEFGSYPVTLTVSDMNGWMVLKTKYINLVLFQNEWVNKNSIFTV